VYTLRPTLVIAVRRAHLITTNQTARKTGTITTDRIWRISTRDWLLRGRIQR